MLLFAPPPSVGVLEWLKLLLVGVGTVSKTVVSLGQFCVYEFQ